MKMDFKGIMMYQFWYEHPKLSQLTHMQFLVFSVLATITEYKYESFLVNHRELEIYCKASERTITLARRKLRDLDLIRQESKSIYTLNWEV